MLVLFQFIASQVSLFHHSAFNASRFGFASSASPEPTDKEQGSAAGNNGASTNADPEKTNGNAKLSDQSQEAHMETNESGSNSESQPTTSQFVKRRRRGTKRIAFSDSDLEAEGDLSVDDLKKLVVEKEDLLTLKQKEVEAMKDKVLRSYAEMENLMERTRREGENSKKFAIQVSLVAPSFV